MAEINIKPITNPIIVNEYFLTEFDFGFGFDFGLEFEFIVLDKINISSS